MSTRRASGGAWLSATSVFVVLTNVLTDLGVVEVLIGMVKNGETSVRFLDVLRSCATLKAEYLVERSWHVEKAMGMRWQAASQVNLLVGICRVVARSSTPEHRLLAKER